MTFLTFKMAANGFSGLYQINGQGPWRNEYKTDSLLSAGEYLVMGEGKVVGKWLQSTLGHQLVEVAR
jgi:hypothetical protein